MRIPLVLCLAGLASCTAEENWQTAVYGLGGVRQLPASDWEPIEQQPLVGLEGVSRDPRGVWGVEFGGTVSYDEGTATQGGASVDVDGRVVDLYLGPRVTFGKGRFLPFLSAGFAWLYSKATTTSFGISESVSDTSNGIYARAGVDFLVTDHLSFGVDARYVFATHFLVDDVQYDADGLVGAIRIGWTF